MERVIDVALKERRPVYIGIPSDYANSQVVEPLSVTAPQKPTSDKATLEKQYQQSLRNLLTAIMSVYYQAFYLHV